VPAPPGPANATRLLAVTCCSKGFVVRPDGQGRCRYKWDDTTVQLYLYPKPGGKTSLTVQHTKLADGDAVGRHRAQWRAALAAVADHVSSQG
jgi:hypothetical protein